MANMPGAEQAAERAKDMPGLGVGVHLNLLTGKRLCDDEICDCLCDGEGKFRFSAGQAAVRSFYSGKFRKAVRAEFEAQIRWMIDKGIKPTHLDSHKHLHTFGTIYPIAVELAGKYGIGAIRNPVEKLNGGEGVRWPGAPKGGKKRAAVINLMARIDRVINSEFIKNNFFIGTTHTGKIDVEFLTAAARSAKRGVTEVMTHPGYIEDIDENETRLVEERKIELEALCSERVRQALREENIELINYGKV